MYLCAVNNMVVYNYNGMKNDGLILRQDTTLLWQFDGGYVALNANGTPTSWNYYITDHLGSTRMVVDSNDSIREVINYYPFGSEMQMTNPAQIANSLGHPFRFTGKELDKLNGLNMYDFGARLFDVAGVPMWTSVDPLAEKYYPFTPYSYCAGDPVNKVDLYGEEPTYSEALAMAQHVYGDVSDDVLIGGWQCSSFNIGLQLSNPDNGLNSKIYERIVDGNATEYAYVTAGTVDIQDKIQDMKQLFGVSEQYKQSMENAEILSTQLSDRELTYIGHSLGGGEAGINLLATAHHNPDKRSAITFNSAGVSGSTLNNLGLSRKYEDKITSYEMGADIISWGHRVSFLPNPLGKREVIAEPGKFPNGTSHRVGNIPMKR